MLTDHRNAPQLSMPCDVLQHSRSFSHWKVNFGKYDINIRSLCIQCINHLSRRLDRSDCKAKKSRDIMEHKHHLGRRVYYVTKNGASLQQKKYQRQNQEQIVLWMFLLIWNESYSLYKSHALTFYCSKKICFNR